MTDEFHILSLDGGGVRGLFSAAVLAAMEEDLGMSVTDCFDLLVGTSTGGIIAIGLGLGLRPREIVDFYYTRGTYVFSNPLGLRSMWRVLFSKYSQSRLEKVLREPGLFGERALGESARPLVIPSYSLSEDDVYLFKTDHDKRLRRDWKVPAWQVALATCAAPTYFRASSHVANQRHVDGGLWANNPVMVAVTEAVSVFGCALDKVRVLSLGTTSPVRRRGPFLDNGGCLPWALAATDVFLRAQSLSATNEAVHLLGKENVIRIDPLVPDRLFGLDTISRRDELLAKAAHVSRSFMPLFHEQFGGHRAAPYTPAHARATVPCGAMEVTGND